MHKVLRIIVRSDSISEAVNLAEDHFKENLIPRSTYDYCKPMVSGERVAGSDRWTQYEGDPLAFKADRGRGRKEIREAFELTQEEFARYFATVMCHAIRRSPDAIQEIIDQERGRSGDPQYEEAMGLVHEDLWSNNIVNPDRIEDRPRPIDQETVDVLMRDRFDRMRTYFGWLKQRSFTECYLFDASYYADSSGSPVDSVEFYEEINDGEYLKDRMVVPLDAHY